MLDRTDAGLRGALDCLWRICVRADIATESLCFFHGRSDLARRELQAVERIVGRCDAAGHHDLHLVASLTHLLAARRLGPDRPRPSAPSRLPRYPGQW